MRSLPQCPWYSPRLKLTAFSPVDIAFHLSEPLLHQLVLTITAMVFHVPPETLTHLSDRSRAQQGGCKKLLLVS